ncbi:uncharacterized protein BO97DRAFT_386103 [Aspergillus homomorphus CBS 101889]|uniref:ABC transporter domain-containing protein n=1 Tax=Aspergillus homomorphus (strain CBS 101889) TaxID=1450537 RepID=A0A395I5H7_ASPHC|nr:hypothetical protein BO97DRAFT_386103 [Aspergillus homomorphus CBS 101889]RAL14999.1 hypothetical protein BO97DRAFT_386103 [Aspergillus homomorphus CBS 101889]
MALLCLCRSGLQFWTSRSRLKSRSHVVRSFTIVPVRGNPSPTDSPIDPILTKVQTDLEKTESPSDQLPIYRHDGRALGVAFDNITVKGNSGGRRTVQDLPQILVNILAAPLHFTRATLARNTRSPCNIVQGVSGVIFPGETMLVLGRPGSGCTTMLKVIANNRDSFEAVEGHVQYGGCEADDMTNELKSEVVYSSEDDVHFPTLTVRNTLDFALKLRKPANHPGKDAQFSAEYSNRLMQALGIAHTRDTVVGDSYIRGISGGERRRVSLAEAMTVNSTLVSWDNPIRGLDSSSALAFLRLLKRMSRATGMANVVTLYQASESMYHDCFDRTLVMYDGRMIFSGNVADAKQYFVDLGFHCPDRQTTPDFLTAVTSPAERTIRPDYQGPLYLDPDSLAKAFQQSPHFIQLQKDLKQYATNAQASNKTEFRQHVSEVRSKWAPKHAIEPATIWKQIVVGTERYYRLFWGDWKTFLTVLALCSTNAVIAGSGFYAAPKTASGSFERSGALFFTVAYFCLNALTEVVKTVNARSILLKQHNMGLIHPVAYAIIQTLADIPSALIQTVVFACCYYFLIGLSETASQFFIFVLIAFVHYSAVSTMFRMLGAWSPSLNISHLLAGCALPVCCLYSGYGPPVPTMHRWGSWIRRVSPTPYALEALIGNEFYNIELHCTDSQLIPSGPGYNDIRYQACPMQGAHPHSPFVDGAVYAQGMYAYTRSHLWRNFGIILVFWFLYTVLGAVGLRVMTRDSSNAAGPVYKRDAETRDSSKQDCPQGKEATSAGPPPSVDNRAAFTFENLSYFVNVGGREKQLLDNVSGYVKPGQLTALMGASGAGKTTLLDNLSQRKSDGRTTGEICLGGTHLSPSFARSCGFCMQQDIHEPNATVREALQFSAMLRQPAHTPREKKLEYVEHIISLLELENIADALVGSSGDGQLNVEERKRVTIGVELAAKPSSLLFLDEPTSGLDSQAAFSIVAFLQKIAAEGVPVVCTIHQPSGVLFEMFDHVILLAPGGRTVYFGETGAHASIISSYFARHGAVMGSEENPAEFIISTVTAKGPSAKDWPHLWNNSPERQALRERIQTIKSAVPPAPTVAVEVTPRETGSEQYALSIIPQIMILTQRHWRAVWRNGQYNFSRLFKSIFFEMFVSFTFFHITSSSAGLQNHMLGILLATWAIPLIAADVQSVWYEKWSLFEARERNGIYDYKALLAALVLVEIPWFLGMFTLNFLVTYWTFGFASTASIAGFVYFMFLLFGLFGLGFIYMTAALFPNATMAGYAMSLFWVTLLMFSGAANPRSALNSFYRPWLWWADPMTYYFEATVSTVLHGVERVHCAAGEMAVFDPVPSRTCGEYLASYLAANPGYVVNLHERQNCQFCPYSTGDDYAQSTLSFYYDERWRDWAVFLGFCLTNLVVTFLATWVSRVKLRLWRK